MSELTPEITESRLNATNRIWCKVGSRITCNPPPTDTDYDYLVLGPPDEGSKLHDFITEFKFAHEGQPENELYLECDFGSYRKDLINLIVCEDSDFYDHFKLATDIAKYLNLMEKLDRIILFQAILYRNHPDNFAGFYINAPPKS